MANKEVNGNDQLSSTSQDVDSDELSSSYFSSTDEDTSPEERENAAFGTSYVICQSLPRPANCSCCSPNDDVKNKPEFNMYMPGMKVPTPNHPTAFVRAPVTFLVPYDLRSYSSTSRVYNSEGIHIATGLDLCDCNVKECPGCQLSCKSCGSCKCGSTCRRNRNF